MSQLILLATQVENEREQYKKRVQELESELRQKESKINQLEKELQLERLKNFVLTSTCKDNKALYEYKDDGIHFFDNEDGKVGVYVDDFLGNVKKKKIKTVKEVRIEEPKSHKSAPRAVKNIVDEEPVKQEELVLRVENELKEYAMQNGLDISLKDTQLKITTLLKELHSAKVITKHASAIRELRHQLLGVLDLDKYIAVLNSHVKEFTAFLTSKKHETKKITTTVSSLLYPIEQRLIKYGNYYDTSISPDEVNKLEVCLIYHMPQSKRYVPFNFDESIKKILNHGLALFPIKSILTRMLINKYGFPNVVYRGERKPDMFAFYTLETADSKRVWKMDCRLLNLADNISKFLITYCINMFRTIYFDVFNHNKYVEGYESKAVICREDCVQLFENIISLSKPKQTCDMLRNIVSEFSTIKPTEQDKFNFQADDKLVSKNYQALTDGNDLIAINVKRMFDEISDDDVYKLII